MITQYWQAGHMEIDLKEEVIISLVTLVTQKVSDVVKRSKYAESHPDNNLEQQHAYELTLRNEYFWWSSVQADIEKYAQIIIRKRLL